MYLCTEFTWVLRSRGTKLYHLGECVPSPHRADQVTLGFDLEMFINVFLSSRCEM